MFNLFSNVDRVSTKGSALFHRNIRGGNAEADQINSLAQDPLKQWSIQKQ